MKRTLAILLVMTMFAAILGGCSGEPVEPPYISELDEEIQNAIKQTCLDEVQADDSEGYFKDKTIDDVDIDRYYGTYNDCVVVKIYGFYEYTQALWEDRVAGVKIQYYNGCRISAWKDGVFYELKDAYEQGLLTRKDIKKIAAIQNR